MKNLVSLRSNAAERPLEVFPEASNLLLGRFQAGRPAGGAQHPPSGDGGGPDDLGREDVKVFREGGEVLQGGGANQEGRLGVGWGDGGAGGAAFPDVF